MKRLNFNTTIPASETQLETADGPINELSTYIDELRADPESLHSLISEELSALEVKIPLELKEGDDPLLLSDPLWLSDLLEQVKPLLMERLTKMGGSE